MPHEGADLQAIRLRPVLIYQSAVMLLLPQEGKHGKKKNVSAPQMRHTTNKSHQPLLALPVKASFLACWQVRVRVGNRASGWRSEGFGRWPHRPRCIQDLSPALSNTLQPLPPSISVCVRVCVCIWTWQLGSTWWISTCFCSAGASSDGVK